VIKGNSARPEKAKGLKGSELAQLRIFSVTSGAPLIFFSQMRSGAIMYRRKINLWCRFLLSEKMSGCKVLPSKLPILIDSRLKIFALK
jgi:hypothetical protein